MKTAVVGAGIMGQLLSLALIEAGNKVSVFDDNNKEKGVMNCSMAAAGLLSPISELEKSTRLIYDMGMEALAQHWPHILSRLNADIYFRCSGCLILSHPQDKADLRRLIDIIGAKLNASVNNQYYKKLIQEEIVVLEPELSKFEEAYHFPNEAHLDNQALLIALQQYLCSQGVSWHQQWVTEVAPGQIKINHEIERFDIVFDCRGMGAKANFPDLQGIRGELIWLYAPEVNIKCPIRLQHPRYSLYLAPRPNHVYLIGASEIHAENYEPISVRSALEFLTAAFYVHSGFAEARILKTVTQCRPTFADTLPKIKYAQGLVAVNGLYRHGFLIAPALAAEILRWLAQGVSAVHYPQIGEFYDSCPLQ